MTTVAFSDYAQLFSGTWKLISWEMFSASDPPLTTVLSKPHGDDPHGRATISQSGYLSVILCTPSAMTQPLEAESGEWPDASDAEVLRISRGLTAYGGPMTLVRRDDGGWLWHTRVEISQNPNWVGHDQTRLADRWEDDGQEYMTLRPVKEYVGKDGQRVTAVLKWQRIAL